MSYPVTPTLADIDNLLTHMQKVINLQGSNATDYYKARVLQHLLSRALDRTQEFIDAYEVAHTQGVQQQGSQLLAMTPVQCYNQYITDCKNCELNNASQPNDELACLRIALQKYDNCV